MILLINLIILIIIMVKMRPLGAPELHQKLHAIFVSVNVSCLAFLLLNMGTKHAFRYSFGLDHTYERMLYRSVNYSAST